MKRPTISDLQRQLKDMKSSRDYWEERFRKEEQEKFRLLRWAEGKFNWWVELATTNSRPCLKYLIKDTAILLGMKVS